MKNGVWFLFKSHICTCVKKVAYSFILFWFHAILGWTNKWNRYFLFFSTLVQQILPICSRYNKNAVWSFLENVSSFFSLIESEISEWAIRQVATDEPN